MWITTVDGYFSLVCYPDHGLENVVIRARSRADLEALRRRAKNNGWTVGEIKDTPAQDYPARMTMDRVAAGQWLAAEVMGIDYPNFKNAVKARHPEGERRANVYGRVWGALLGIEQTDPFSRQMAFLGHGSHMPDLTDPDPDLIFEDAPILDDVGFGSCDPVTGGAYDGLGQPDLAALAGDENQH